MVEALNDRQMKASSHCKSVRKFFFLNSVKRHICDVKVLRLGHDLPCISVNDIVILPFHKDLFSQNFACAKFCENKTLAKISEFTVFQIWGHTMGYATYLFRS